MTPFSPYKSGHMLAQLVKIALIAGVAVNAIEILATGVSALFPHVTGDEEFETNPGGLIVLFFRFLLLLLSAGIYITTVVLFLVWLHRSYKNLPTFGASRNHLSYSPGWAVGVFFIPFANLALPFRVVRELWQNSVPPEDNLLSAPSTPIWFGAWWGFWIACCIVGNIAFRAERMGNVSEDTLEILGVISEVLTVIAGLLAVVVVGEIDKRQEETSQRLKLGKYSPPPPPFQAMPGTGPGF